MSIKIGDYEIVVKKGEAELDKLPDDLPVHDFEGNTVTLKEVQEGYMRNADYTQKTQSVAEMKKFMDELGFQSQSQGIDTMKRVFDTLQELEDRDILDTKTGEIKVPGSTGQQDVNLGDDDTDGFTLGMENLPPELRSQLGALKQLQQDMGSLMGYISRKEIRDSFPGVQEEEIEMVHKLAAIDPSKSPIEHMAAYSQKKEEWGQKAVDLFVEEQKKPKKEGHDRELTGPDDRAIEIFGEEPVFSFMPGEHAEGANVVDPSKAADAYLQAAMDELKES